MPIREQEQSLDRAFGEAKKQAAKLAKTHYAADTPVPRISHALVTVRIL